VQVFFLTKVSCACWLSDHYGLIFLVSLPNYLVKRHEIIRVWSSGDKSYFRSGGS